MQNVDSTISSAKPVAIATVVQVQAPTSAKPGDKALIGADGILEGWVGGGCVQPAIVKISAEVLKSGQPCLLRVAPDGQWDPVAGLTDYASSCLGRGSLLLFIEPMQSQPTLCIYGESAVALSLAEQAVGLNINVILQSPTIDTNSVSPRLELRQEYSAVDADYIVVATQGKGDKKAITCALASECMNVRMVVSRKKLQALKSQLIEDGLSGKELDRLTGPAGINIGAQLPAEIALSVLAEIIQHRRNSGAESGQMLRDADTTDTSEPIPDTTSNETNDTQSGPATKGGCCG